MPYLFNFHIPDDINTQFENKIKRLNAMAGRGEVILHGDKTRYIIDALRDWIHKN
jgi:hypothetical protein